MSVYFSIHNPMTKILRFHVEISIPVNDRLKDMGVCVCVCVCARMCVCVTKFLQDVTWSHYYIFGIYKITNIVD